MVGFSNFEEEYLGCVTLVSPSFPKLCKALLSELTQANSGGPTLELFALSISCQVGRSV